MTEDVVTEERIPAFLILESVPVSGIRSLNCKCAVMEQETTFNILNNRLSLQNEHNPISCRQELLVSEATTAQALVLQRIRGINP